MRPLLLLLALALSGCVTVRHVDPAAPGAIPALAASLTGEDVMLALADGRRLRAKVLALPADSLRYRTWEGRRLMDVGVPLGCVRSIHEAPKIGPVGIAGAFVTGIGFAALFANSRNGEDLWQGFFALGVGALGILSGATLALIDGAVQAEPTYRLPVPLATRDGPTECE